YPHEIIMEYLAEIFLQLTFAIQTLLQYQKHREQIQPFLPLLTVQVDQKLYHFQTKNLMLDIETFAQSFHPRTSYQEVHLQHRLSLFQYVVPHLIYGKVLMHPQYPYLKTARVL